MGDLLKPGVKYKIGISTDTSPLGARNCREEKGKRGWYDLFGTSCRRYGNRGTKSYMEVTPAHAIRRQAEIYEDNWRTYIGIGSYTSPMSNNYYIPMPQIMTNILRSQLAIGFPPITKSLRKAYEECENGRWVRCARCAPIFIRNDVFSKDTGVVLL